jgi:membrane fusion protein, multidrug efflux system
MRIEMNENINQSDVGLLAGRASHGLDLRRLAGIAALVAIVAVVAIAVHLFTSHAPPAKAPPTAVVSVSIPLQRNLSAQLDFLGQFSAVERVELRAQVGGTLTEIHFRDGDLVKKGDLLFVIDPVPYEIRFSEATAQLESAKARLDLATRELTRAQALKTADAGSAENVEQRVAEKDNAKAGLDNANALVRDARFDLDHCRIAAPFSGRIGTHLVSTGNLVSGTRGGSGPTTLLTTLVSLDPMYLDFDMSEADYMTYLRERAKQKDSQANKVDVSLSDETNFTRQGTLNFIDNALDRSSGTIHARAILHNEDLLLTPGGFARARLAVSIPQSTLLVPDAAVLSDQSDHAVLVVGKDNVVSQKKVEIGELRGGLRVIRSGLTPTDKVIIEGIPAVTPGARVSPQLGSIRFASDQE